MIRLRPNTTLLAIVLAAVGCGHGDTAQIATTAAPPAPAPVTTAAAPRSTAPVDVLAEIASEAVRSAVAPLNPAATTEALNALAAIPAPVPQEEPIAEAPRLGRVTTTAPKAPAPAAAPPATAPPPTAPPPTTAPPATAPPTTAPPPPPAGPTAAPGPAADLAGRVNGLRGSRGLAPLARDGGLDAMAAGWARQMAQNGSLSHSSLPQQMLGRGFTVAGENVGYGPNVQVVHDALTASPSHMANIVGAAYTRIGVGAVIDGNGRLWVVQLFGG